MFEYNRRMIRSTIDFDIISTRNENIIYVYKLDEIVIVTYCNKSLEFQFNVIVMI